MSNDTHDTHEPTGARLTDYTVVGTKGYAYVEPSCFVLADDGRIAACYWDEEAELIRSALADRAALVAENARLQAQIERDYAAMVEAQEVTALMGVALDQRDTALAQVAAMRPLVVALAKITPYAAEDGDVYYCMGCQAESVYYDAFPHDADCRIADAIVMAATSQTPAAPEGGDDDCGGTNGPDCRCAGCWTRINETIQALHAMRDAPTPDAQEGGEG
ncbi:MAG TPA: hypothetical protein VMV29_05000 [Ktedonobacterales bacterium]|nr:hypothetical protein [Ktedonobacterales bacterium]